jgi:hypothetical protein
VVGFDTTILPGREGSITEEVSLAKVHDGPYTKCITVTSNAHNRPDQRLCIKGTVKVPVMASTQYIQMKKDESGAYVTDFMLVSEKADLQVNDVSFTPNTSPGAAATVPNAWQNNLPIYCSYKTTKSEKPRADGSWEYKLVLKVNGAVTVSQYGEFTIKTNHPDMPEVKSSGMIEVIPADQKK